MYNHPTSQDAGTVAQATSSGSAQQHLPELSESQPLMRLYDPEYLRSFYNHPTSQDLPETSPESPTPEIQLALATGSNPSETSALFDAVPQAQTPVYTPEQAAPTDPLFGSNDANPTLDPTPSEPAQFTQSTEQVAQSPSVSVDLRPAIGISEATQTSELSNFPQFVSRAGERGVTLPNNEGEYLAFDGSMLMHVKNGEVIRAWPGVSGKDGFQSREHETERNIGPLPEGTWMLSQDQYQEYQPFKLIEPFGGDTWFDQNIGTGRFPRGTNAWGRSRVQILTPEGGRVDERTGRDNFSIHGGTEPGSAGCIDLTIYMDDFSEVFTRTGKDLPLIVAYPD